MSNIFLDILLSNYLISVFNSRNQFSDIKIKVIKTHRGGFDGVYGIEDTIELGPERASSNSISSVPVKILTADCPVRFLPCGLDKTISFPFSTFPSNRGR